MSGITGILEQPISEAEIIASCRNLRFPDNAFHGPDGNDARSRVLQANASIDVSACPGSGKTTMLVAKLSILAQRWTLPTSGMCVLSHTNVARSEIEKRLGGDASGRNLLGYPHFIGTIHAFVNQFVAMPWLRSKGIEITAVDDDICLRRRLFKLDHGLRRRIQDSQEGIKRLRITDVDHNLAAVPWGNGYLGRETPAYRALLAAGRLTTAEGFFCHNDMLLWAREALERNPEIAQAVRCRFPMLFLDEVQDNTDLQTDLLHRLFMEGDTPVVRQRFGDMNQAIYERASDVAVAADLDRFPDAAISIPVSNSHRFGSQIAALADPLAPSPPGLVGLRNHAGADQGQQAAILFFDIENAASVLPAFAGLITARFSAAQRATGEFAAIGAIHRDRNPRDSPNCVAHYWSGYDHQLARAGGAPDTLIRILRRGVKESLSTGDMRPLTESAADGLLRLSSLLNPAVRQPGTTNRYRQLMRLLAEDPDTTRRFHNLCWALAEGKLPGTAELWRRWSAHIATIASRLVIGPHAQSPDAFMAWEEAITAETVCARTDNVFAHPPGAPEVRIKVGSIHSVKGETHLATLVFDTHFRGSHFKRIRRWILGEEAGSARGGPDLLKSLKQHYVALTRPSHLLCLAMRKDSFTEAEIATLRDRQWNIADIVGDNVVWRG
ncbi:UvrD-helicase domain-containing protein [Novosphingobium gossypii]|uniref:UvrD-helicase domain-containing protein n=1 Tax=Novosphingobium gossypii TaxID=1604774 RepID=UPI003D220BFF